MAAAFPVGLSLIGRGDAALAKRARRAAKDPGAVRVEILAQQWSWSIRYAGPDGRFGTEDDLVTQGDLRVAAGRPILLQLRSKDVFHSLYLPNLGIKLDVPPEQTMHAWFSAEQPGQHDFACADLCGVGHYKMRGQLTVYAPPELKEWLQAGRSAPPQAEAIGESWGWTWEEE